MKRGLLLGVWLCWLTGAAFGEDGQVIKQYNYLQTTASTVVPVSNGPYSFAEIGRAHV